MPLLDIENVLPILEKISLLGGLSEQQLYTLFRLMETVQYRAGDIVFSQGSTPSHIYIVRKGQIKMVSDIENTPLELIVFGAGQCFGEASLIGIQPHSATAIAVGEVSLLTFSGDALHAIYEEDKELFGRFVLNIAREIARRLHKSDEISIHYALGNSS
jgi:CRP-like cAMP-binding protein